MKIQIKYINIRYILNHKEKNTMKKCLIFLNLALINFFLLLKTILFITKKYNIKCVNIPNEIKTNNIINNRILFNDNETKEENYKDKFFVKNYNITLFSYEQLKSDFINLANNYPSNMTIHNYINLIQKKYLIIKLINSGYSGYSYSNNFLDEDKFYNSFFEFYPQSKDINSSHLNEMILQFYIGKNLTSNKDVLIIYEKYFNVNKTIYLFSNIEDIIIENDKNKKLFKIKILEAKLFNEEYNDKNKCLALIQMIFKSKFYSFTINKNNISQLIMFNKIGNKHCYMMIKPSCIETKSWISCYRDLHIFNDDIILNNTYQNNIYKNNKYQKKAKKNEYNIKLMIAIIFSSIINIIYNFKFINDLSKKIITINSICFSVFYSCYFYSFDYIIKSIATINKTFHEKTFARIKLILILSNIFSIINFLPVFFIVVFFNYYLLCRGNLSIRQACFHLLLFYLSYIINWVLFLRLKSEKYFIIISCIVWASQIIKNIIFKNKVILPLFYYIFFSLDKFIFVFLDKKKIITNSKKIISLLIINIAEITIIFMQGYLGPRFMLCSLCNEKNDVLYISKEELLKQKQNSKDESCSICLLSFINNKKSDLNDSIQIKTNNELKIEKEDSNFSKEISENKNTSKITVDNNIILEQKKKFILSKNKNKKYNFKKLKKIVLYIFNKFFWDYYYNESKLIGKYAILKCGHFFHSECINLWINEEKKCPICRQHIFN